MKKVLLLLLFPAITFAFSKKESDLFYDNFVVFLEDCFTESEDKIEPSKSMFFLCKRDYRLVSCFTSVLKKELEDIDSSYVRAYNVKTLVDSKNMSLENPEMKESILLQNDEVHYSQSFDFKEKSIKKVCSGVFLKSSELESELEAELEEEKSGRN